MFKDIKKKLIAVCLPLGIIGIASAMILVQGGLTNLVFTAGVLDTPFTIAGVPTSSGGQDVPGEVCVIGDFDDATGEFGDVLAEDAMTVLTTVGGGVNGITQCGAVPVCYAFTIPAANYTAWAADGTLDFTLVQQLTAGNPVDDICGATQNVQASVTVPAQAQQIPTLSTWALLFLSSILLLIGIKNKRALRIR